MRRRERARRLGYLTAVPVGQRFVSVPFELSQTVKPVIKSLALHREHDGLTQLEHHSGKEASLQAFRSGFISGEEHKASRGVHRAADRAKHRVSATKSAVKHASHGQPDAVNVPLKLPRESQATPPRPSRPRPSVEATPIATSPPPPSAADSHGTPGGRLLDELARTHTSELDLLQRVTQLMANLLVRIRVLEQGLSAAKNSAEVVREGNAISAERVGALLAQNNSSMGKMVSDLSALMAKSFTELIAQQSERVSKCETLLGKITRSFDRLVEDRLPWDDPQWHCRAFQAGLSGMVRDITEVGSGCLGEQMKSLSEQLISVQERVEEIHMRVKDSENVPPAAAPAWVLTPAASRADGDNCASIWEGSEDSNDGNDVGLPAAAAQPVAATARPLDYSRFDTLVISDDDEDERRIRRRNGNGEASFDFLRRVEAAGIPLQSSRDASGHDGSGHFDGSDSDCKWNGEFSDDDWGDSDD